MKDIKLWQLLDSKDVRENRYAQMPEIKGLLVQLCQLSPRARLPYFGRLNAFPKTDDWELRQLQMQVLSGASGWKAWEIMLNHTRDSSQAVRRAATDALIESAELNPWVLAHVAFHPDQEIRIQVVEHFANRSQSIPAVLLYLMTDETCQDLVATAVAEQGLASRAAPQIVIALHQSGRLSIEATRRLIATMTKTELHECLDSLPKFSDSDCQNILTHQGTLPIELTVPVGADYDGLQWVFELFWEFDDASLANSEFGQNEIPNDQSTPDDKEEETEALAARLADDLYQLLTDYFSNRPLQTLTHIAAVLIATAHRKKSWNIRLVGLCAALSPNLLLQDCIPSDVRRKAAGMLYRLRDQVIESDKSDIQKVIQSKFCRRENGQLDLWLIGAVLHYARKDGLTILMDCFTENQFVASFLGDPNDSVAFFSYSGSVKKRQKLLDAIRAQRGPMSSMLEAMLVYVVPADGLQFLDGLSGKQVLSLLAELIKLSAKQELSLSTRKVSVVGSIMNVKLTVDESKSFLNSWMQMPDPKSFDLGLELLALFSRKMNSTEGMINFALSLDVDALAKLVECVESSPGFPYGTEIQLAARLVGHSSQPIREWAIARAPEVSDHPQSSEGLAEDACFEIVEGDAFPRVKPAHATSIETCSDRALEKSISVCLKAPLTGVCSALAARPDPVRPNLLVATAILGSADPMSEIDSQFQRFGSTDAAFLTKLDASMVGHWQSRKDLPIIAAAWLCRWENQAFAFAELAMGDSGQLKALLSQSTKLSSAILMKQIWYAAKVVLNIWRYREIEMYRQFIDRELLSAVITELTGRCPVIAAEILVNTHNSRRFDELLDTLKASVIEAMPDFSQKVRTTLEPWIDSRGFASQRVVSRKKAGDLEAGLLNQINQSIDVDQLMEWCRDSDVATVTNSALRCVSLGGKWLDAMMELFLATPRPKNTALLAETISLWPEEYLKHAESLMADRRIDVMTRFLIGLNLAESGKTQLLESCLEIACEEATPSWLQRDDLARLQKLAPHDDWLAIRLAASPHPHAYQFAVNQLIGRDVPNEMETELPQQHANALRAFLDCGTGRLRSLRLDAATTLEKSGDHHGYALLLEAESEGKTRADCASMLANFPPELAEESVTTALLAGGKLFPEERILRLLKLDRNAPEEFHAAAIELNSAAVSNKVRQQLARHMRKGLTRSRKLQDVAEVFAWGIPLARELTQKLFTIDMIGGDDYGYTRLNENKIYINPLPIMQRKPNGRAIVEGLILHELGHHMYHCGESHEKIWEKARKEGLGSLLNLVSDELLERRLRTLDGGFGDRLKKLGAHVFQHSNKEVNWHALLESLNLRALPVLSGSRMKVARRPNCVKLSTRRVMQEMEKTGLSFSRFFRAMRLGLGNRYNDPKVAEALKLFGKDFRNSSMKQLYEITLRLREIFGSQCAILNCFDQSRIVEGEGSQVMIDGEGITNGDIQSAIHRITKPLGGKAIKKGGAGRCINVGDDMGFRPITMVERVNATRAEHANYAKDVIRYANQLRRYLTELGLVMVPQRRRIRGRSIDRGSLQTGILKRDPRILKFREPHYETDLFIGVVIDCSGSMEFDDNIEKAKLFGALLTEAVRGMTSVDLCLFGFTDSVIYDAGTADRPGLAALTAGGGNNDAAALLHAAQQAQLSRRRSKLLVMISDGLPTECSVKALRSFVTVLTRKWNMCCAQVAVQPLEEICFPNYVLLDTTEPGVAVREFGITIAKLIRKSLAQTG